MQGILALLCDETASAIAQAGQDLFYQGYTVASYFFPVVGPTGAVICSKFKLTKILYYYLLKSI